MKKLLVVLFALISFNSFAQNPSIGHFQTLSTVRRGDTLDVAWFYQPVAGTDIRTFQVDFQYKKTLFTYLNTTVDNAVNGMTPTVSYKNWDNYKYSTYSNGTYTYTADTNWAVGRNYLVLSSGTNISSNGYIIHNKYKINNVAPNYASDTITVNWARMFKVDGTTIGDNIANLTNKKLAVKLLGNLTISGKVWLGPNITSLPQIICTQANNGAFISSTTVASNGTYTLINIDENTKYKLRLQFPQDSLLGIRDNGVTIADAVKAYNEYTNTDVNQAFSRTYLKNGLAYLIGDINKNGGFDGGDPYSIYASVSGLKSIDTTTMISTFSKAEYDSLALGANQWTDWANYINRGNFIFDSVGTVNLTVDIKYFVLGDVDRTHSSPVYDAQGNLVLAARYNGNLGVHVPDTYAGLGQPLYVPFNINTNGLDNTGLQFEMRYDPTKVRFEEIVSNIQGPWLQYVTHDDANGIIRFGGMDNQIAGALNGTMMPFKLKFSPIGNTDVTTDIRIRKLMDASDKNGDHFNIALVSDRITLMSRMIPGGNPISPEDITASINPNPNTGLFEVVVAFPKKDITMNALVYDGNGRLIKRIGELSSNTYNSMAIAKVDLTNVASGNYYLVLANSERKLTKPFIIM
jgi:hypothetical protein